MKRRRPRPRVRLVGGGKGGGVIAAPKKRKPRKGKPNMEGVNLEPSPGIVYSKSAPDQTDDKSQPPTER
ncbi:MAG: hypothetical protein KTV68_15905 [Acidimicrobiia bacterium]|nr:hypothetical protein [Acidimicrobiia bacterium]